MRHANQELTLFLKILCLLLKSPSPKSTNLLSTLIPNRTWDAGDVTRPPNPDRSTVVRFTPADFKHKSNESMGVWKKTSRAYKLFKTTNQYDRVTKDIETAKHQGLPYAGASTAQGLVYTYENPKYRHYQGFAVVATWYDPPGCGSMDKVFGRLHFGIFSIWRHTTLSKGTYWCSFPLGSPSMTFISVLRIKTSMELAVKLKVSDPQGFIYPTTQSKNTIQFVDIHYGSDVIAKQMLAIVEEYM
ncbi:hypothetical protein D9757_007438 [Collybiopsis confluens]|uniref:Uncharacterized protein n=1 Tax=Collybiopsis confluens TaxID=2823264 RepID=A0A8H5HIA7_9AGAR|nr:hypothetical protein D9757_007438 [Collybiopsis confluens]